MTTGVLFALITALCWTSYNVIARKLAVKSSDPLAVGCIYPLCAALITGGIFLFQPNSQPITADSTIIIITILGMLCYGVFDILQFFTYKHLEISYRTVLTQVTPIVVFVAATSLLGETVTIAKIVGIVLIIGGNIFALHKHSSAAASAIGIRLVLISSIAVGLAYVGDKVASSYYPLWFYIFLAYVSPWIIVVITAIVMRGKQLPNLVRTEVKNASWRIPVLAMLGAGGYYFFLKSFAFIDSSTATPIAYTSTILTALAGIVILQERGNIPQKIAGAVAVFIGVMLLG